MKTIDLEAHFLTTDYVKYLRSRKIPPRLLYQKKDIREWMGSGVVTNHSFEFEERFLDFDKKRIDDMDQAGIKIQVLSLTLPGCEQFEASEGTAVAKQVNDELSTVVKRNPDRFIGLATLAPQDPLSAARELERAVVKLGLKGAKVNSHVQGEYLDNPKFWKIFEKAEILNVPIYLHPAPPSPAIANPFSDYGIKLAGPAFGFAIETALHAMRLIHSGLFDKYPKLKIILGHLGEALPFWLNRIDFNWLKPGVDKDIQAITEHRPSYYVKNNFLVTTSGMTFTPAFICTYLALGADNMLFASDYPYENSALAVKEMEAMPICDVDKNKIMYRNAENLFRKIKKT